MTTLTPQTAVRPIGRILVDSGIMDQAQVEAILDAQQNDHRPFGLLAEVMFQVDPEQIEQAWQDQYLAYATQLDLDNETIDPAVVGLINRRQARQFELVPIRVDGDELIVVTTRRRLRRTAVFAWRHFNRPVFVTVCDQAQMDRILEEHYRWD
jgi:hypothetical protein